MLIEKKVENHESFVNALFRSFFRWCSELFLSPQTVLFILLVARICNMKEGTFVSAPCKIQNPQPSTEMIFLDLHQVRKEMRHE